MSVPHAFVSGQFLDGSGVARAGHVVQFLPLSTPFAYDGQIVVSIPQYVTLSGTGTMTEYKLLKGYYRVVVTDTDAFFISVPGDGLTYNIDVLAAELDGLPSELRRLLTQKEIFGAFEDSSAISVSNRGDRLLRPERLIVLGETGDASADVTLQSFVNSLLTSFAGGLNQRDLLVLGNANPDGTPANIDATIGQAWHNWMGSYAGAYPPGHALGTRFWYALGSEDWEPLNVAALGAYFSTYPGNRRYFKALLSPGQDNEVSLFIIDSSDLEPDGNISSSVQAAWLQTQLGLSTSRWNIVAMYDSPQCSVTGKSKAAVAWPFAEWGADLLITSGAKVAEVLNYGAIKHLVMGSSGTGTLDTFGAPHSNSLWRNNAGQGFFMLQIAEHEIAVAFIALSTGAVTWVTTVNAEENQPISHSFRYGRAWSGLRHPRTSSGFQLERQAVASMAYKESLNLKATYLPQFGGIIDWGGLLPTQADVTKYPILRNCIVRIGNDPAEFWVWNAPRQDWDLMMAKTFSSYSYYNGSRPELAQPTLSPENGSAAAVTVAHTEPDVEYYVSINGAIFELTDLATFGNKFILPHNEDDDPVLLAVFARKAGFQDSPIVYGQYRLNA